MEFVKMISSKKALYKTRSGYKIKKVKDNVKPEELTKDETSLYKRYRKSAELRGYEFNLSTNTFKRLIYSNCLYCGIEPKQVHGDLLYNGIDRLDNSQGYFIENALACCKVCNRGKSTMSHDEFQEYNLKIFFRYLTIYEAFENEDLELAKKLENDHLANSGVLDWRKKKQA
jgi:hypothetical protein